MPPLQPVRRRSHFSPQQSYRREPAAIGLFFRLGSGFWPWRNCQDAAFSEIGSAGVHRTGSSSRRSTECKWSTATVAKPLGSATADGVGLRFNSGATRNARGAGWPTCVTATIQESRSCTAMYFQQFRWAGSAGRKRVRSSTNWATSIAVWASRMEMSTPAKNLTEWADRIPLRRLIAESRILPRAFYARPPDGASAQARAAARNPDHAAHRHRALRRLAAAVCGQEGSTLFDIMMPAGWAIQNLAYSIS